MRTEIKWINQHGVKSFDSVAVILSAADKVRSGEYVGSKEYPNECRLAYELVEFMNAA